MKTQLPVIFEYIDFRKYLGDYYAARKAVDTAFSHSYICHRLGQANSKSYFNNVLKSRAPITAAFVDRFIGFLELKPDEAKYFRALVNYNQTMSPHEKEFFFDQLVRLNRTPHKIVDKSAYDYYKEWYHTAIRALLDIIDFKDDYKALASRLFPSISIKQARDSIDLLKRTGMISRNGRGFWKPTDKVIVSGNFIKDALVKQFQMKCLEHGKTVLASELDRGQRTMALTLSLSDEARGRITQRMEQFKSEIRSIVHKDEKPASRVFHLNLNLFPMSK
jgi:uncharacterized protein (TIGR02147 family)